MKKLVLLSSALCVLASYSANAQISVTLGEPAYYAQPVYTAAPDYPSEHYDHHRHKHNDYWAAQQRKAPAHDAHDNGNHEHR